MWFFDLYRTAVAKKAIMGLTGLILFGFVLTHMGGNLKIYQGPEKFNAYAEHLRVLGTPLIPEMGFLWIARFTLLAAVGLHIWSATTLTMMNRRARPVDYELRNAVQVDYASRTMRFSGYLLAFYIVYHLMHFTIGNAHPDFVHGDAYRNVVLGFKQMPVALVYIVANVLLGFHLYHGLWSLFQSLGWNHPTYNAWRRHFAIAFSVVVSAGFISIPFAVLTGIVS